MKKTLHCNHFTLSLSARQPWLVKGILFTAISIFCITASYAQDTWTQKANFEGGLRTRAIGFSIGAKGYIGTGLNGTTGDYMNDFWEYDPSTDTWAQKANVGGSGRIEAVGFSIGSKGYIGTGFDGSAQMKDFWEYDPSNNTWAQKADFGGGMRHEAVSFSINGRGYIGTGIQATSNTNDFWEYNPGIDTWRQIANFAGIYRGYAVGFSIGNKGYVGTGWADNIPFAKDFWEYNPATDLWTQKADFGGSGRRDATGFSIGSKGYIGTGYDGNFARDFWEYDAAADSWSQKPDFGGNARLAAVSFSIGNKGYIATGHSSSYYLDCWQYLVSNTITTNAVAGSPFCAGTPVNVSFSASGNYNTGNTFTVQLSDNTGSFAAATNIGTLNSTTLGIIAATIPASTPSGTAYRIRVVSSNPVITGGDNGANITINGLLTFYRDADNDGFGDNAMTVQSCSAPTGYVATGGDCNNNDSTINPNTLWIIDNDNDGYSPVDWVKQCESPGTGWIIRVNQGVGDCDDNDPDVHPFAPELCDGKDNNCNGVIDEGVKTQYYRDADDDGYGDYSNGVLTCNAPEGYVATGGDCDDSKKSVHPGAKEICGNGIDDNCDGQIDENCSVACAQTATNPNTTNITSNSATLNWNASVNPNKWQIRYKKAGAVIEWVSTIIPGTSRTFNISLLDANQKYIWQVRAKCNGSIVTNYTGKISFKTFKTSQSFASSSQNEDEIKNANALSVKVVPNPVQNILNVQLTGFAENVIIQLRNPEGKVLKQQKIQTVSAKYTQQKLNVTDIANGIYFLVVIDNKGNMQTEKIIVNR